jgi:translation elongation factor EF-Ts
VAKHNPADVAALGALPYSQDGFGPTLEDVRKGLIGKIGENMSFRRFKRKAASKLASTCTARASACWSSSKVTKCRQGRGHARGRHEAGGPGQR